MRFPNLVYKSPGAHQGVGGTYDYLQVVNYDDLKVAIDDGWYPSPELAISKPEGFSWGEHLPNAEPEEPEEHQESIPLTREELEVKAMELNIKFNDNWKDETLVKKINEILDSLDE